jgi:hypothetical protein
VIVVVAPLVTVPPPVTPPWEALEDVTVKTASLSTSVAVKVVLLADAPPERVMIATPSVASESSAARTRRAWGVDQLEVVKVRGPPEGEMSASPLVLAALTETVEAG